MRNKRWIRLGLYLLVIAGLAAGLFLILTGEQAAGQQASAVRSSYDPAGPLVMQKSNLYKQRDRVQKEYTQRIQGMGTVTLLFTQPDAVFMDVVVPLMEQNGLTGMVAFGVDYMPGMDGCMTLEQWRQLEKAGWGVCYWWDGQERLSDWMEQLNGQFAPMELPASLAVYVPEGLYNSDLLVQARQMNLRALVHHGESGDDQHIIQANDVWTPMAMPWHLDQTSQDVETITKAGGSIVLEVKNEIMWDGGYRRLFKSMLEQLVGWQNEDELRVATVDQAVAYRQGVLMSGTALEAEMRRHLEALDLQINAIDEQIDALNRDEAN